METQTIKRYPLDFDVIHKGDIIARNEVERIVGLKEGHPQYNIKAIALCNWIERELDARGEPCKAVLNHGAIRVLFDHEALEYLWRHRKLMQKRSKRYLKHLAQINVGNLTGEQRSEKDRRQFVWACEMAAQRKAVKQALRLEAYVNKVPRITLKVEAENGQSE